MSNHISTFNFKSNPVRIEVINNEPHFCLTDVCLALSISNANSSRFKFNEAGVHKMYISFPSGKKEVTFINEPNLYRIIFRSNKSQAIEFQNWVFEEVLPQIRKTGQYSENEQQIAPLAVQDQDLLSLLVKSYHFLQQANELRNKVAPTYIASDIDLNIGGHYLYNLGIPLEQHLDRVKGYIHQSSERIMFVKGMLSLLEEPKRIANF